MFNACAIPANQGLLVLIVRAKQANFAVLAGYKHIQQDRIIAGDLYEGREYSINVPGKDFASATVTCPFHYADKTLALTITPTPDTSEIGKLKFVIALTKEQSATLKGNVVGRVTGELAEWKKTPIKIELEVIIKP
jgi:hypothetical protein